MKISLERTGLKNIWHSMKKRCHDENDKHYKSYGGRGIKVCDRWLNSFDYFLLDMGEKPTCLHSLDRIDVNKDYEPSNCRWATWKEQGANKRNTKTVTINNETKTVKEWAEIKGISQGTLRSRVKAGWDLDETIFKIPTFVAYNKKYLTNQEVKNFKVNIATYESRIKKYENEISFLTEKISFIKDKLSLIDG